MSTIAHKTDEKPRTEDIFVEGQHTFDSFLLSAPVRRGLDEAGFYKPSPIQVKAIPLGKCGLDLIVKAKSGTGKTLVFVTIALEMIKVSGTNLQVLIIAPTREIADQIVHVAVTIGKYIEGLNVGLFIGGLSYETDVQRCKNCHIAVGTPGRVKHLVEQNHLNLKTVKLFILDEADKLMTEDFQSDINYLYTMLSEHKQFLAVSATMTNDLNNFLDRYMYSPTVVTPGADNSVLLGLRQFVSVLDEKCTVVQQFKSKIDELVRIFSQVPFTQCLVFSNYQQRAESISNILNQQNWNTTFITGSQSQEARLKTINKLKNLECKILLTTDLTARGIDASNVDLVVNYDVPLESATYLHRMGRTGRYGSLGICITIAFKGKELLDFQHILGDIGGTELLVAQLPTGRITEDVWKCDLNNLEKIQGVVNENKKKIDWETSAEKPAHRTKKSKKESKGVSKQFKDLSVAEKRKEPEESTHKQETRSCEVTLDSIQKLLKTAETTREALIADYSKINSETLLQSLAEGQLPQAQHENQELINPASLYPWVPVEESVLSKNTGINLLADSDDSSTSSDDHMPLIQSEIADKKLTLSRNIALYHVCKILKSEDWDCVEEAVQPLDDYFRVLAEKSQMTSNKLTELCQGVETDEICSKIPYFTDLLKQGLNSKPENICQVAYDYIINGNLDWRNLVEKNFKVKKKTKKPVYVEHMDVEEEMEEEETGEGWEAEPYNYEYNAVEEYDRHTYENESYSSCFNYYDQALSNAALTFEDVPTFKGWFQQWRGQVQSVRKYVQDKLYLKEMNNYEYYCNYQ